MKIKVVACLLGIVLSTANAKELFPESVFPKNSAVMVGDTLAQYPIYVDGPGWTYTGMFVGSSTGTTISVQLPTVYRAKRVNGVLTFGASTTVNVGQGPSGGWTGEPCGGDTIFKINVVRGMLDRCAVMRITEIPIAGVKTQVLQAEAIETNSDGRYYRHTIFAALGNLGLSPSSFLKGTPFEPQAMAWLQEFLNATIKAADFNKSSSHFAALPSFENLITAKPSSKQPQTKSDTRINDTQTQVNGFEEKLLKLKRLFESGLISESEYKNQREKVLKEL